MCPRRQKILGKALTLGNRDSAVSSQGMHAGKKKLFLWYFCDAKRNIPLVTRISIRCTTWHVGYNSRPSFTHPSPLSTKISSNADGLYHRLLIFLTDEFGKSIRTITSNQLEVKNLNSPCQGIFFRMQWTNLRCYSIQVNTFNPCQLDDS